MRPKARSKPAAVLAQDRKQKRVDLTKEMDRLRRRIIVLRQQQEEEQEQKAWQEQVSIGNDDFKDFNPWWYHEDYFAFAEAEDVRTSSAARQTNIPTFSPSTPSSASMSSSSSSSSPDYSSVYLQFPWWEIQY